MRNKKLTIRYIPTVLLFIIAIILHVLLVNLILAFDTDVYQFLFTLTYILFVIGLAIKINFSKEKKTNTIFITLTSIFIVFNLYYFCISMLIEPILHLHFKYELPIYKMRVTYINPSTKGGIFDSESTRSAYVKYEDMEIYVRWHGNYEAWTDEYEVQNSLSDSRKRIADELEKLVNRFVYEYGNAADYKINTEEDPTAAKYDVFIYKPDKSTMSNLATEINFFARDEKENNDNYIQVHLHFMDSKKVLDNLYKVSQNKKTIYLPEEDSRILEASNYDYYEVGTANYHVYEIEDAYNTNLNNFNPNSEDLVYAVLITSNDLYNSSNLNGNDTFVIYNIK